MSDYDNTDRGALFKNDKKDSETHPDYKGSINVGGTDYWLSAWLKTSNAGAKYMSLSVKAKDAPQKAAPKPAPMPQSIGDMDDEIPFNNPFRGKSSYVV
jgi:uncharacterized protein (DUF736 family)